MKLSQKIAVDWWRRCGSAPRRPSLASRSVKLVRRNWSKSKHMRDSCLGKTEKVFHITILSWHCIIVSNLWPRPSGEARGLLGYVGWQSHRSRTKATSTLSGITGGVFLQINPDNEAHCRPGLRFQKINHHTPYSSVNRRRATSELPSRRMHSAVESWPLPPFCLNIRLIHCLMV